MTKFLRALRAQLKSLRRARVARGAQVRAKAGAAVAVACIDDQFSAMSFQCMSSQLGQDGDHRGRGALQARGKFDPSDPSGNI